MSKLNSLENLTKEQCYQWFTEALKISDIKWDSALYLSEKRDFGSSINIHITSIEELIKAIIMLSDSKGFEFRKVKGMENILQKSHTLRHFIGFTMIVMDIFREEMVSLLEKVKQDPSLIKNFEVVKDKINSSAKVYINKWFIMIREKFLWFKKLESLRQEGAHVGYNLELKSPLQISKDEYTEICKQLETVRLIGKQIIELIQDEDPEMVRQKEIFKNYFLQENWYYNIEICLKKTKRKNPFEVAKNLFGEVPLEKIMEE